MSRELMLLRTPDFKGEVHILFKDGALNVANNGEWIKFNLHDPNLGERIKKQLHDVSINRFNRLKQDTCASL